MSVCVCVSARRRVCQQRVVCAQVCESAYTRTISYLCMFGHARAAAGTLAAAWTRSPPAWGACTSMTPRTTCTIAAPATGRQAWVVAQMRDAGATHLVHGQGTQFSQRGVGKILADPSQAARLLADLDETSLKPPIQHLLKAVCEGLHLSWLSRAQAASATQHNHGS